MATRFYEPLAQTALQLSRPDRRAIVAIAGPPGSGKTAFAITLAAVMNTLAGEELAVPVGMDGWHFPNAYLDTHFVEYQGASVPLRRLKGSPPTYDIEAIACFLARVCQGVETPYPVYSRLLHDPVPGGGAVGTGLRIILLEGNYWLLDEPPWNEFQALFDLRIFLTADPQTLIEGLRQRHHRGGKTPAVVAQQLEVVDLPNIERVLQRSVPADIAIDKIDGRRISGLKWMNRG